MRDKRRAGRMTREAAEAIAARAFLFLAEESGRLGRFLAETGLDPGSLRGRMQDPAVLGAVLGYLMSDESALLAFAANAGVEPEDIARAEFELGGGSAWEST
ncbi:MAG: DUF3572 domain-containing protein [Hyphomicrobiaceae bacterium]